MNEDLYHEYGAAIGAVMEARKRYDETCAAQGAQSWAAEQAHDYLEREIGHRDQMRERYDAASDVRLER